MKEKSKGMFLTLLIIVFILFLNLISIIFNLSSTLFKFEFILLVIFLVWGLISVFSREGYWKSLLLFFGLNLINLIGLYWKVLSVSKILLPLTMCVLGFLIAMIKTGSEEDEDFYEESIEEDNESKVDKSKVKKTFEPGKYVASKTGKKYHAPKCDWAKKINKKNRVWFDNKEEAEDQGYEACNCVK